jgi:lantibiotic modifying enzyme
MPSQSQLHKDGVSLTISRDELRNTDWRPLLADGASEEARKAIFDIAAHLSQRDLQNVDASLYGGAAGLALFYAYLSITGVMPGADERAAWWLEQAIDAVAAAPMPPALYGGYTGVAWATSLLQATLFDPAGDDPNAAIDEVLCDYLDKTTVSGHYDLVSGDVGLGVYALERLPHPYAHFCLERIAARLADRAERHATGITWHTAPELLSQEEREAYPQGQYNLGVAHGVPGVIALLGQLWAAGIAPATVGSLLDGAVAWLRAQKLSDGAGSCFPYSVYPNVEPEPARLAWCYGDLGIAAALLVAARCTGEAAWEREAITIACAAAACPLHQTGIADAGLCHGAAGVGHLLNRLYQATGEPQLGKAARFWFERTLDFRRPGQGIGGFLRLMPGKNGLYHWTDDPGILTGAAGIGLALLAATTSVEPAWDRMLLIAGPAETT